MILSIKAASYLNQYSWDVIANFEQVEEAYYLESLSRHHLNNQIPGLDFPQ
jgi:hypothetical protein